MHQRGKFTDSKEQVDAILPDPALPLNPGVHFPDLSENKMQPYPQGFSGVSLQQVSLVATSVANVDLVKMMTSPLDITKSIDAAQ